VHVSDLWYACEVQFERGATTVDQTEYVEKKAAQFGITGDGHVYYTMPMEQNFTLDDWPAVVDNKRVALARLLNGSLICATLTRPECKYPCSKLATVVTNPTEGDVSAMRRVLQYLYHMRETQLTFKLGNWTKPDGTLPKANQLVVYIQSVMLAMLVSMKDIVRLALRIC
jgi:hypothetical protein